MYMRPSTAGPVLPARCRAIAFGGAPIPRSIAEMHTFSGRTLDVPAQFIAGKSDWGVYQTPGAVDKMRDSVCTHMAGFHLLDGAGHWAQQEQPEMVSALLVQFLREYAKS